ncbi:hypothetical protein [Pseudovibrio sp. Tun.PSC04-5.I4]|uniref:hypothetical protein n=1 Tax=Pseudovibrio sp. Tun.PSC04-5.I4 TaxID=1798213 RepID=UPI000888359E|nr:hypothetical protein [Pseudovibrio sp. Tun.PSC04-5.I4]SDR07908.1 hypothetical protein SAMN04515695_2643 [Pseudovibrio sp. Tun.PSC04-5.I4]
MIAFFSSLVASRLGRVFLKWAVIAALVGLLLLRAVGFGRQSERNRQMETSLLTLRKRNEIDADISRHSDAGRRRRLRSWSRK